MGISIPGLHPLVCQSLSRRGFSTPAFIQAFLDPELYSPAHANELPGLAQAVQRIETAIRKGESICIWGDFDVDGQTATTLVYETLLTLGANVAFHIPVREQEGHGVDLPVLKTILDQGVNLVITCDTGVTAHEAVDYARTRQVEVIITDHHDPGETLPAANAVVNPKLLPVGDPLSNLSGVGVAYKLAEGLAACFPQASLSPASLLDLVALGLVADLAILQGDSRYLVQKGLTALRETQRLGLQVMLELADIVPANLNEEHISFGLAPRLNALGRLGDANPAVELLTTRDPLRARQLATNLENLNLQRQLLCSQVTQAALDQLRTNPSILEEPVLVLGHAGWPAGVVGIVASRLVERYHKPALLFSFSEDGLARGSARSIEGLNIHAAISAQKQLLLRHGGHPMAAGLSLETKNLPEFSRRLSSTARKMLASTAVEEAQIKIEGWLELGDITLDLAAAVESLAPFGPGNEKVVFASSGLTVQTSTPIGKNKDHAKLIVQNERGDSQNVIWWNGAGQALPAGKFDLAFTLRTTDWRAERQVQMELVDYRTTAIPSVDSAIRKFQVNDMRNVIDPIPLLEQFHSQSSTVVWAEGKAKTDTRGKDRTELIPADHLVIWSIPPSPEELKHALEDVKPRMLTLVCAHPDPFSSDDFINRLTGILKYICKHADGNYTYTQLAAGTAQRLLTVQKGVAWLESRGGIVLVHQEGDYFQARLGTEPNPRPGPDRLWEQVQDLLAETAAYRDHFRRAKINLLDL